ncbi:MAG TPA: hypothetical protein HA362_06985 [Nanoarchaeota archaeon]|nr:hypothetical protein [Nanoarchaeota archaeon]
MPKIRIKFWDSLVIIGAIAILAWALLKSLGIIHSPVWVEMVPYFGGVATILGIAYKIGKITKGIEDTEKKVNKILDIEQRFSKVEHEPTPAMAGKLKRHFA